MWEQGILQGVRTTMTRARPEEVDQTTPHPKVPWFRWLSWRQWLVLFGMGAFVILLELRNHRVMWLRHGSGQTIWTDPELVGEIIVFGLILPILGGSILSYQARTAVERDQMAKELELRRRMVARIHEAESWTDLTEIVVQTPGVVVPAAHTWLMLQRSSDEPFTQVAHWHRPGNRIRLPLTSSATAFCEECLASATHNGTHISRCDHVDENQPPPQGVRYCLTFSSAITGKAALLFELPVEQTLARNQLAVLEDLGKEISLAIDNANLSHLKQHQDSVAREERLRIARNLHDTLGQNISYLRLKLEQLNDSELATDPHRFQNDLVNMLAVADEAYLQVRDTLDELRTSGQQDLEAIVKSYALQIAGRAGLEAEIKSVGEPQRLSATTARQLLYIMREALNNVEKHAGAATVNITLTWLPTHLEILLVDDGNGFATAAAPAEGHYGLSIMSERARAIHADLAITSSPRQGTHLKLCLPMPKGNAVMSREP